MDGQESFEHLQKQIYKYCKLLKEYEHNLLCENDPRQRLRWQAEIKEIKQIIKQHEEEINESRQEPIFMGSEECPYRGLEAFEEEHAKFFLVAIK